MTSTSNRATRPRLQIYTLAELATLPSAADEWVIAEGILSKGGKILIYGKPGAGKTTLLDELAISLASGRPFLSAYDVRDKHRVLVVQGELSQPELSSHALDVLRSLPGGDAAHRVSYVPAASLKLPHNVDLLEDAIRRADAQVVILDPFYKFFSGDNSDKPEQVQKVFEVLDELQAEFGLVAVGVVHHENVAGGRPGGSWAFEAWPSVILRLTKDSRGHRSLKVDKLRLPGAEEHGVSLRLVDGQLFAKAGTDTVPDGVLASQGGPSTASHEASTQVESDIKRVRRLLRKAPGNTMARRDLLRSNRALTASRLDAVLAQADDIVVRKAPKRPGGGRAADLVHLLVQGSVPLVPSVPIETHT